MNPNLLLKEKFSNLQFKLLKDDSRFNSDELQKNYSEVYQNLFSNCAIVCSAPVVINWTGKGSVYFGGLGLSSKLPLRVYVGIESTGSKNFEIGDFWEYDFEEKMFKMKSDLEIDNLKAKLQKFLPALLKEINGAGFKFSGFRLHILSEYLGIDNASLMTSLVTSLFLYFGKVKPQDIGKWNKIKSLDLISGENPEFDRIFRLSWKMSTNPVFGNTITAGIDIFSSLVSSRFPILYWTEKRMGTPEYHPKTKLPANLKENFQLIEDINYFGCRLEEIFDLNPSASFFLDFGLIYPGKKNIKAESYSLSKSRFKEIIDFSKNLNQLDSLDMISELAKKHEEDLVFESAQFLNNFSLNIFYNLKDLIKSDFEDNKKLTNFLEGINSYRVITEALVGHHDEELTFVYHVLRNLVKSLDSSSEVAVKETHSAKGERILFIAPYGAFQEVIDEGIDKLKEATGRNFSLEYASWKDGIGEEGIKVEQDLKNKVYSKFINPGSYFIKIFRKDGKIETKIITIDEFEKQAQKFDLLLDNHAKKIYFKGKLATSKEVHSVLPTLNIFPLVLKHQKRWVKSSDLPFKTYSKNRYEFQSKIISKIRSAVKKYSGKDLKIQTSGKIYDFEVRYIPSIDICLIKDKV